MFNRFAPFNPPSFILPRVRGEERGGGWNSWNGLNVLNGPVITRSPIHQDRKEYQLRCLLSRHAIRQPPGCQLRFEVPPNARVF